MNTTFGVAGAAADARPYPRARARQERRNGMGAPRGERPVRRADGSVGCAAWLNTDQSTKKRGEEHFPSRMRSLRRERELARPRRLEHRGGVELPPRQQPGAVG